LPRHPSQLYEAFLEGLLLFIIVNILLKFDSIREKRGMLFGLFVLLYSIFRFMVEFLREPDLQLGFMIFSLSMGQVLSLTFTFCSLIFLYVLKRK